MSRRVKVTYCNQIIYVTLAADCSLIRVNTGGDYMDITDKLDAHQKKILINKALKKIAQSGLDGGRRK